MPTLRPAAPDRNARTRSFATILAVLCITAVQAGCGASAEPSSVRIALLPVTEAVDGTWEWTPTCRVGPRSPAGCEASAPAIGTAQLAGNAWNLGGGADTTGAVRMSLSSAGGLQLEGDLSSAPPCTHPTCIAPEANTWVRGYPSVLYGIDQCNAATSPPQSPGLQLPMRVGSIPSSLIGSTTYTAQTSQITYTIAYDLWLNPSDTKTPCRTDGTLEVMVWTDHDARSLLPDSMRTANASIPYSVDGSAKSGDDAWRVYVSNVFPEGRTAPWGGTVWLVLDEAHSVKAGSVSVDLSVALAAVGGLLRDVYGWSDFASSYWLDTIAFGIEFGPDSGHLHGSEPIDFAMDLTAYCLEVGTTVAAAGC
jgi:hypothetical protein